VESFLATRRLLLEQLLKVCARPCSDSEIQPGPQTHFDTHLRLFLCRWFRRCSQQCGDFAVFNVFEIITP